MNDYIGSPTFQFICDVGEFRPDNLSLFALKGNRTLPFIFLPWYVWGFKLIVSRGQSRDSSIRLISVTVNGETKNISGYDTFQDISVKL